MKRYIVICLALLLAACQGRPFHATVSPEFTGPEPRRPAHHQLHIAIDPAARTLSAEDRITLTPLRDRQGIVAFYLDPNLQVEAVSVDEQAVAASRQPMQLPRGAFNERRYARFAELTRYEVVIPAGRSAEAPVMLSVRYSGSWPTVELQGASLTGGSGWYPTWPNIMMTFALEIDHPADWEAVSAGTQTARQTVGQRRRTTWSTTQPTETIDLFAGPYAVTTRTDGVVPVSAYFFHDDTALAPEYLDAAAGYLERYGRLLGPYPFPKLAIVETPLPIGAAAPSITLLGQSLIKRHYTQPYALGHEIVHAWIGNHVMADEAQGNWTEALTTYLANYYTIEETAGDAAAREQRQQMMIQYATWTTPATDYPLMRFLSNDSQSDAAIGYHKGAMVFHLLRRMMGDDDFFGALRDLNEQFGGKRASWNDLRLLFEARSGRPLDWFFRQWIVRAGAPQLAIDRIEFTLLPPESTGSNNPDGALMTIHLRQAEPWFRVPVMLQIETTDRVLEKALWIDQADVAVETAVASPPSRIVVDPDHHLFRRLERDELPPMLNLSLTEPSLTIVLPDRADPSFDAPYRAIAAQAAERATSAARGDGALLLLGGPDQNRATAELATHLPPGFQIGAKTFTVEGHTYRDTTHALLLTIRDPARGNRPTTLFYGLSIDAVSPLVSTLWYHGWDSYIIFERGRAVANGTLPPLRAPLVWTPSEARSAPSP